MVREGKRSKADAYGAARRRRTRQAAKSPEEEHISVDTGMSEWGNPAEEIPSPGYPNKIGCGGDTV